jgi:polyhydroxybutyrate depolymerase
MVRATSKKKPKIPYGTNVLAIIGTSIIFVGIVLFLLTIVLRGLSKADDGVLVAKSGSQTVLVKIGETTRTYRIYTPSDFTQRNNYPLVFVFHGGGGNGKHMEEVTRFSELAESEKFIAIYPDGEKQESGWLRNNDLGRTWNAVHCCGFAHQNKSDDITFVKQIIADVTEKFTIDTTKIFATGFSNGGMFVYKLATEMEPTFAKIAVVGGSIGGQESLSDTKKTIKHPSEPISTLIIHGMQDQNVKYWGGESEGVEKGRIDISVSDATQFWRLANGCNTDPIVQNYSKTISKVEYSQCVGNTSLLVYSLVEQGHAWPGSEETNSYLLGITDRPSKELDATKIIWDFFKTK